jgi:predicted nucleic acid-binding protein
MSVKTFVDTNVLIYGHDVDAGRKHERAAAILRDLWAEKSGLLSMQVLQEFYVNVTRKISRPLSKPKAREVVDAYKGWCIETTLAEISTAFQIEDQMRLGFWDAMVIAAAVKGGAGRLLSEDLNPGQEVMGVRIENPFTTLS